MDGNLVTESSDLTERVGRLKPGDKINLTVSRDGQEKNFSVTLKPLADEMATKTAAVSKSAEELYNKLGGTFMPLSPAQKTKYRVNNGVLVTQVREGGVLDQSEIPRGSVITSVNKQPVNNSSDIGRAVTKLQDGNLTISGRTPDGTLFNNTYNAH